MKRILAILLPLLLLGSTVLAETDVPLSEDERIAKGIEIMKEYYLKENLETMDWDESFSGEGYLEIVHTQAIYIRDEIRMVDEDPKRAEKLQKYAEGCFGMMECIVEFVILVDPGYGFQPTNYASCCSSYSVFFMKDGTVEGTWGSWCERYRGMAYSEDFTPIIESISDRNYEFNNTWYLLK